MSFDDDYNTFYRGWSIRIRKNPKTGKYGIKVSSSGSGALLPGEYPTRIEAVKAAIKYIDGHSAA